MQYVLLIYQAATPKAETLSQEEYNAIGAEYGAINKTPGVTPGLPLGLPEKARTVRVQNGKTVATQGPLVERGVVGGYFVFEAVDINAATALAATIPAARLGGAIEVRPVETYW
jgi:hypothetical protein